MPLGVPHTREAGGSTPGPSHPLGTRDGPSSVADDAAQPNRLHVLRRDHDGHVAVDDAQHVELALAAGDDLGLDPLDDANAMRRIDDLLTNLERTHHSRALRPLYSRLILGGPPL